MSIKIRNNVRIYGDGSRCIVFAHGFGCDQSMWRYLVPQFSSHYKVVLFDLVGAGRSDLSAYLPQKYATLQGHADDLLEIIDEVADTPVIFVGHSVSTMIGLLACNTAPEKFVAQIMVSPSPCYVNHPGYTGGFTEADIDDLLNTIDSNYLGWSSAMAPVIMGAPDQPELGEELANSFCQADPAIARHFARVTFLSDYRSELGRSAVPALILQCTEDIIAPVSVGHYMAEKMPHSTLQMVENFGHCPHMSAPDFCAVAIRDYLDTMER